MKTQHPVNCDCIQEIDRMIDEGLSGGTVDPKYTEAHLKLKEKYQPLPSVLLVEISEQGGDIK